MIETRKSKKHVKESNKAYYHGRKSKNMLGKRFRKLGVWMIAKKLHPHPQTPNPKCSTKERKIECKSNNLCFGENGRIRRPRCVFLGVYLGFFGVLEREKM